MALDLTRISRWRQLACLGAALAVLGACASHPKAPPPPPPPPAAPAQPPSEGTPAPPEGATQGRPLPGSAQDFVINIGDRIYFDFDKYDIRADAAPILAAQAGWLSRYALVSVRIEGNCDERGTREYNFALGARRAAAVRQFLIDHGVAGGRITTISYGKEQPIDPGQDETAWAKDRNAHTAITGRAR
jgi:peptidoglycan-associated lipoprotein